MRQTLGFRKDLKNEKSKKIQSSSEKNSKIGRNRNIGKPSEKSSKIGNFPVKSEDLATLSGKQKRCQNLISNCLRIDGIRKQF